MTTLSQAANCTHVQRNRFPRFASVKARRFFSLFGLTEHEQPREVACVSMATNGGGTTKAKLALVLQMVRTGVFYWARATLSHQQTGFLGNDADPDHVRAN